MIVSNPEELKNWLAIILEPLCDADPSALARYVLALLKKEKPMIDLANCMREQLDVFLAAETVPFLERLFAAIHSGEYMKPIDASVQQKQSIENALNNNSDVNKTVIRECTPPIEDKTKPKPERNGEPSSATTIATTDTSPSLLPNSGGSTSLTVLSSSQDKSLDTSPSKVKEDVHVSQNKDTRRRRISNRSRSRSRTRSRSRSFDRVRRSRSRDRRIPDQNRDKAIRQYRNKSPAPLGPRRYNDRKVDRTANNYGRPRHRSGSASRSRSKSIERTKKSSRSISPVIAPVVSTEVVKPKRQRCRDFDEKGYCMRGETCPWDHGVDPVVLEDINNPSLMNIQNSNTSNLRTPVHGEYNPDTPDLWIRGAQPNFGGAPRPAPQRGGIQGGPPNVPGPFPRGGIGHGTTFRGGPPFPSFQGNQIGGVQTTQLQRELISVPVQDGNNKNGNIDGQQPQSLQHPKRRFDNDDMMLQQMNVDNQNPIMSKRKLSSIASRLGPRVGGNGGAGGGGGQQNCSLELRKIPRGLNAIAHLNNHFSKFGKIINIQISYEGDPEAAIITFSTHAEANVAYRSTEAVLNNRFIKVFWHSGGSNQNESGNNANGAAGNVSGISKINDNPMSLRRNYTNNQYHTNNVVNNTVSSTDGTTTTTTPTTASNAISSLGGNATVQTVSSANNTTTTTITTANSISRTTVPTVPNSAGPTTTTIPNHLRLKNQKMSRATNELIRKKQEEQQKTAVQLAHGLHKRKHDLLQEYLKQMRSLVDLVERTDNTDPQRAILLTTINELQSSIEKLRKEIQAEQTQITAQMQNQPPARKTKEQQQKELLDIELELITQEHDGNDTTAIQKRLLELKSLLPANRSSYGPIRTPRSVPRLAPPGSTSVDRRPTSIQITGFVLEDSDIVLGHFKHYGEITKNVLDKNVPSLTISYATRPHAEQAILRGRIFKDKPLQISWAVNNNNVITKQKSDDIMGGEMVENNSESGTTELRSEEEEEEEEDIESEDRSWRR